MRDNLSFTAEGHNGTVYMQVLLNGKCIMRSTCFQLHNSASWEELMMHVACICEELVALWHSDEGITLQ